MTSSTPLPTDLTDQWHHAAHQLGVSVSPGTALRSGLGGRTLSGPVMTADGLPAWLRVMAAPRPEGKIWEGAALADACLKDDVPRPALLGKHVWGTGPVFQAQVWERLKGQVISPSPDLSVPVTVEEGWWKGVRAAVESVRATPTPAGRQVMTQAYIGRIPRFIPQLEGRDLTVRNWESAHGDLHWAQLTQNPLAIIDWEGWGAAPSGYDAAVLHAYALPVPQIAAKVREVFADALAGEDGRLAELVIAAEIIQASERDEIHARLKPFVQRHVTDLLSQQ